MANNQHTKVHNINSTFMVNTQSYSHEQQERNFPVANNQLCQVVDFSPSPLMILGDAKHIIIIFGLLLSLHFTQFRNNATFTIDAEVQAAGAQAAINIKSLCDEEDANTTSTAIAIVTQTDDIIITYGEDIIGYGSDSGGGGTVNGWAGSKIYTAGGDGSEIYGGGGDGGDGSEVYGDGGVVHGWSGSFSRGCEDNGCKGGSENIGIGGVDNGYGGSVGGVYNGCEGGGENLCVVSVNNGCGDDRGCVGYGYESSNGGINITLTAAGFGALGCSLGEGYARCGSCQEWCKFL